MKSEHSKHHRCLGIDGMLRRPAAPLTSIAFCAALCLLAGCITINNYQEPPGGKDAAAAKPPAPEPAKPAPPAPPKTLISNPVKATLFLPVMPFSKRNWAYSCKTVINNSWDTLKDYPVRLTIPRKEGMQTGYGDLRFTDARGKELNYWLEEATPAAAAVWVNVPRLEAEGETAISLYYGNDGTDSASDGSKTFLFFDDFSKGFDDERWERGKDYSNGGCGAGVKDGALEVWIGDGNHPGGWARTRQAFPPNLTIESRCKLIRKNNDRHVSGYHYLDNPDYVYKSNHPFGVCYDYFMDASTAPYYNLYRDSFCSFREQGSYPMPKTVLRPFWDGVWFRQRLSYNAQLPAHNLIYVRDKGQGEERFNDTVPQSPKPVRPAFNGFAWGSAAMGIVVDWIAVRPYAPEEPKAKILDK